VLRPVDGGAQIQVRDEGIGLPADALELIFEPFGRAENTSSIPGMGLGLFICRNIVERHGGRIWAESAGEGQGTTMTFWLPIAVPEEGDRG
jgi:signal transduction histidine kinase